MPKLVKICPECSWHNETDDLFCINRDCAASIADVVLVTVADESATQQVLGFDDDSENSEGNDTNGVLGVDSDVLEESGRLESGEDRAFDSGVSGTSSVADGVPCTHCGGTDFGGNFCLGCGRLQSQGEAVENGTDVVITIGNWTLVEQLTSNCPDKEVWLVRPSNSEPDDAEEFALTLFSKNAEKRADINRIRLAEECVGWLKLHDFGVHEGRSYEVAELLSLGPLSDNTDYFLEDDDRLVGVVRVISDALETLHQRKITHLAVSPDSIFLQATEPLSLVLGEFDDAVVNLTGISEHLRQPTLYSSPEAMVISHEAGDWWSLGATLLYCLTKGQVFSGINPAVFWMSSIYQAVPIPEEITADWRLLLQGLLTIPREKRWGHSEVVRWLAGDRDIPTGYLLDAAQETHGKSITLGGEEYWRSEQYALHAATVANWDEALQQLEDGTLQTWLDETASDQASERYQYINEITRDVSLNRDECLMLVLLVLNQYQPLVIREQIISAGSFPSNPELANSWLEGTIPEHLRRLGREEWLVRLAERRARVQEKATRYRIALDNDAVRYVSLLSNEARLREEWMNFRLNWPDSRNRVISDMIFSHNLTETDYAFLLSVSKSLYRHAEDILEEAEEAATEAGVADYWKRGVAKEWFSRDRRYVLAVVRATTADFVRCGYEKVDEWADKFRFESKLSLSRLLVLLSLPQAQWKKPEGGMHWRLLMRYFRRKVLASIARGPLVALSMRTSSIVDVDELAYAADERTKIVDGLVCENPQWVSISPELLNSEPALQERLRRIRRESESYQRDKGVAPLHLGFPLVYDLDDDQPVLPGPLVPLLLWQIEIDLPEGQRNLLRFKTVEGAGRVRINPVFEAKLPLELRHSIEEVLHELRSSPSMTTRRVLEVFTDLFDYDRHDGGESIVAVPRRRPNRGGGVRQLVNSAVIFKCNFSAQAIAAELESIANRPSFDSPSASLLRIQEPRPVDAVEIPPCSDRFLITDADPSQEFAVYAARNGPGLLIQGPPGTGKSQTIVNIIADAMGRGEKVLLVCQKQAALEVVKSRLIACGLGERSVLVTDTSRDRRKFLESLRAELESTRRVTPYQRISKLHEVDSQQVQDLENRIDGLHQALTAEVGKSGLTLEEITARLIRLSRASVIPSITNARGVFSDMHHKAVDALVEKVRQAAPTWIKAKPEESVLYDLKPFAPDAGKIDEFVNAFRAFVEAEEARCALLRLKKTTFDIDGYDMKALAEWISCNANALVTAPADVFSSLRKWSNLIQTDAIELGLPKLDLLIQNVQENRRPVDNARFFDDLSTCTDADVESLAKAATTLNRLQKSIWRFVSLDYWRSIRTVAEFCGSTNKVAMRYAAQLECIFRFENRHRKYNRDYEDLQDQFKMVTEEQNRSPKSLLDELQSFVLQLKAARLVFDRGNGCPVYERFKAALLCGNIAEVSQFLDCCQHSVSIWRSREGSTAALKRLGSLLNDGPLAMLKRRVASHGECSAWIEKVSSALKTLPDFQRFRLTASNLDPNVQMLLREFSKHRDVITKLDERDAAEIISQAVERESLHSWRAFAEQTNPILLMSRGEFDSNVTSLKTQLDSLRTNVRQLLATIEDRSGIGDRRDYDDYVMLTGPRMRSFRQIVDACEDLGLFKLRPIWLANPESVSELFPLREKMFDVVIFDEASQLPVEYAIPAMYRGKRCVISGDEKQLPPTSFWKANYEDQDPDENPDEYLDETGEKEAIDNRESREAVTDCVDLLELGSPVLNRVMLNVHYRSKYRQLIDFSNSAYYQSRLSVPSVHPEDQLAENPPIQVHHVNGLYENQRNSDEADAVVRELEKIWCSKSAQVSVPSIGVVTFNQKQAALIEDRLEDLASRSQPFRRALQTQRTRSEDGESCGFFVKNLENVQGDERDWMIFSTTFGKKSGGQVYSKLWRARPPGR